LQTGSKKKETIIMKNVLTVLLIISSKFLFAQTQYLDSIYSVVTKTTYDFETYNNETLQFDFYRAQNAEEQLPLLVYVHGGGFYEGSRNHPVVQSFATKLAQRGYAVASVSQRLTMKGIGYGCDVEASKKVAAIDSASFDVTQAIKYMISNKNMLHIDPNKIILAGASTGAYTVLNMAYVYKDTTLLKGFKYAGVISMAGALTTLEKINERTAIPTLLFHGTGDVWVPYELGPHSYCGSRDPGYFMLYGSATIARRLKGLGSSYYLFTANGGSHYWAFKPLTSSLHIFLDFLYYDIINNDQPRQTEQTINDL
jgi:acetyl esterase/lipase